MIELLFSSKGAIFVGQITLALILSILMGRFLFPLELRRQTIFLVDPDEWPRARDIPAGFVNRFAGWTIFLGLCVAWFLALGMIVGSIRL